MPRAGTLPDGPVYMEPPAQIAADDRVLYDYLFALHRRVFGIRNGNGVDPRGDLDAENISPDLAVDHDLATHRDHDGHEQYHTDPRALVWLHTRDTDDVAEGTRLYFTTPRARAALSATAPIAYDPATGIISGGVAMGTVTSVALTAPAELVVTGSPIVDAGTLALAWAAGPPLMPEDLVPFPDFVEPFDGARTEFTVAYAVRVHANGRPQCQVVFQQGVMQYSATNPPEMGCWTFVAPSTFILSEPPSVVNAYVQVAWLVQA